ncbi:MAG: chemotaxis protein CheA [Paenibacillaceae bacterium ZCTH02-B3]|nr:MAG: chemotaxis protein CheA [Paenibacillaceae bacterium ZCTH02-B3]
MEMNQYLSMFIDEAKEHLQALNENLLRLEQQPDDIDIVQSIFRSAHTLKGMSATMGFQDLAALTHEMENVLDQVRGGRLKMNDDIFDTLFKGLDTLEAMVRDMEGGGAGQADVADLVERLKSMAEGGAPSASRPASGKDGGGSASSGTPGRHGLDEYQLSVIRQSAESGYRALHIRVTLREGCLLKAARAYMVFDALERHGEVIKSEPSVQDLEQENFDRTFAVYYITRQEASFIRDLINGISEIEEVTAEELSRSDLAEAPPQEQARAESAAASAVQAEQARTGTGQPAAASGRGDKPGGVAGRTIRVDSERLDALMNMFSELIINRARMEQLASEIRRGDLTEAVEQMSRITGNLQDVILKLRMVPLETVFNRFPRMVRDLAKSLGKKVDFVISGAETELDRTVVDEIGDPLVHLIRNAIDHGLEPVADRKKAGKPETGKVMLRAYHSGNFVVIEIEDDGRGIDRKKVVDKAVQRGMLTAADAARLTDEQAYQLLFASGFSTAETVSDISGRGVGLDVVKTKIESLGGRVSVESTPGAGTRFIIRLPLTLSVISAMLVKLGPEKYAIPLSSIVETGIIEQNSIRDVHGTRVVEYRNSIVPVISLAEVLESPHYRDDAEAETEIVLIRKGDRMAALMVDDFIGQNDIVLKSLGKYLANNDVIFGATILGDGQVALIIDPNSLIK